MVVWPFKTSVKLEELDHVALLTRLDACGSEPDENLTTSTWYASGSHDVLLTREMHHCVHDDTKAGEKGPNMHKESCDLKTAELRLPKEPRSTTSTARNTTSLGNMCQEIA